MDTVSNLPFVLKFNGEQCVVFSRDEEQIYHDNFQGIKIFENEEVMILFDSKDADARLYLDALDVLPDGTGVLVDEDGRIYRTISSVALPLYKQSDDYDALRVDAFRLCVVCGGHRYFSLLEVLPKQMAAHEWTMMRDDLEEEIRGLAQDIVRRNIGLGSEKKGAIPPQKLYTFFVMQKYAGEVLASLIDLQNAPKYHIVTEYTEKDSSKAIKMDSVTIRTFLRKGGSDTKLSVPVKRINYDIQENRLLKKIISVYDRELAQFIAMVEGIVAYRSNSANRKHKQYRELYEQGLEEFLTTAKKLKIITAIIKVQDWFKDVGVLRDGAIPHAFALDSRYGVLYQMYEDLRNPEFKIQLDPVYSYSWKKSSSLYEMWCFVKICRAFADRYDVVGNSWNLNFGSNLLFPYLANGERMSFENDRVRVDVIFDQFIPNNASQTKLHVNPFYTVGKHKRPDITIDIYTKKDDWYIGSLILECKYRRLSSFWYGSAGWSSKPQIQAYYTDNKSDLTYNGLGGVLDIRPIQSVIVLTPDVFAEGKTAKNINTQIKTMKPDATNRILDSIMESIEEGIDERCKKCNLVEMWRKSSAEKS